MAALITIQQAKRHLRIPVDSTEFDDDLELKMEAATAIVIEHIKRPDHGWIAGSPAEPGTGSPEETEFYIVQAAILKVLANLFADRGDREKPSTGPLSEDVIRMLSMQRDPTLA